jgi:hypothetical protein
MTLALLALGLAAAQIVWALSAGAGSDEAALRPFLALADEPLRSQVLGDPALLARNAGHLRSVLDQAALTAFASLCALLWFLKRRDAAALLLLGLVVAGDFAWQFLARP